VRGATTIATASADDFELVEQLGADEVIDYKKERFEDRVREIDLVIDLVGGEAQKRSWQVLKEGGILVSTLQKPSAEEAADHRVQGKVFLAEPRSDQLEEIGRLIDEGKVEVFVSKTLPLSQAKRAHDELEKTHSRGKLVLTVT
jgi:NADPH:quinone reductase-like Zn-dependent oxidoreductase